MVNGVAAVGAAEKAAVATAAAVKVEGAVAELVMAVAAAGSVEVEERVGEAVAGLASQLAIGVVAKAEAPTAAAAVTTAAAALAVAAVVVEEMVEEATAEVVKVGVAEEVVVLELAMTVEVQEE